MDVDAGLMLKACEGDEKAFNTLYARQKGALYRYLKRQCGHPGVAADLFQEVWENIFRGCKRYVAQARFSTFMFTVARHRVIDYYRAQSARKGPCAEEDPPELEELPDTASLDPDTIVHLRKTRDAAIKALHGLPLGQRETFLLFVEGMTLKEIAEVTDVHEETVKSRLRYARNKLKELLRDQS